MRFAVAYERTLPACAWLLFLILPGRAAINAYGLGASYDATQTSVIFRVYSSRATRIERIAELLRAGEAARTN